MRQPPGLMSLDVSPAERGFVLESVLRLDHPIEHVFPFFADAMNLETITPPILRFKVLTPPPIVMKSGLQIDYALRIHGLPIRWTSEISDWDPPFRFVDSQRRGPYRWWRHEHFFEADDGQTVVHDRVEYGVPCGRFIHRLIVQRDLREIFRYRADTLLHIFSMTPQSRSAKSPQIVNPAPQA